MRQRMQGMDLGANRHIALVPPEAAQSFVSLDELQYKRASLTWEVSEGTG